jgi:hypothetical protein
MIMNKKYDLAEIYRKLIADTIPPAYLKWLAEQKKEEKKIYPKLYGKI